jgi:phosphatidylinositol 4-kinase
LKNFIQAQKKFTESLAGYSLISYLFQLKDRHNDNILIDSEGHLIHIDFGFYLQFTPGGIKFENAPFKFTNDYLEIIGGQDSDLFYYFRVLLINSFNVLKRYYDEIVASIQLIKNSDLINFQNFDIASFKDRFHRFLSDKERELQVDWLIQESLNSISTPLYDRFQKFSNNIK